MRAMPYLLVVIATMFWSGNFIVSKWFVNELPPYTLSFIRWLLALIIILPFCWKDIVRNWHIWLKRWKIHLVFAITGIISFNTLVNFALYYTVPTNAALIEASSPILIPFIARLFVKEHLSFSYYLGMLISLLGVLWIIGQGSLALIVTPNLGDLLVLAAVIIFCFYASLTKKYEGHFPETASFAICIFIGLLVLLPFTITEWDGIPSFSWTPINIFCLLFVGCCSSIVAYLFWNKAVISLGPSRATLFLTLIPMFTAAFSALFFGDKPSLNQILGGLFILLGVFIAIFIGNRKRHYENKTRRRYSEQWNI